MTSGLALAFVAFVAAIVAGAFAGTAIAPIDPAIVSAWLTAYLAVLVAATSFALVAAIRERTIALPEPRRAVAAGDHLPRLKPLTCAACGGHLPALTEPPACAFCHAPLRLPDDSLATLRLRARAARELASAVSMWRRAERIASMPVIVALYAGGWLAMASLLAVGTAAAPLRDWALHYLPLPTACAVWGSAWAAAWWLRGTRTRTPTVTVDPARPIGAPESSTCAVCGAPIAFAAGDLATVCAYCGAETYRVALARRAHARAAADEARAALSLHDAMCELRRRRRGGLGALVLVVTGIASMGALVAVLMTLPEITGVAITFVAVLVLVTGTLVCEVLLARWLLGGGPRARPARASPRHAAPQGQGRQARRR